ncbi:MAG: hypothetical protein ACMUIA_01105, partial [bacterium]
MNDAAEGDLKCTKCSRQQLQAEHAKGKREAPSAKESCHPPAEVKMYLDEDRDGKIDAEPASCSTWEWGPCEKESHKGGIIMVQTQGYEEGAAVQERMKITLKKVHGTELPEHWGARLTVNKPDKVRVFDDSIDGNVAGNCMGAQMVIGPATETENGSDTYEINDWAPVYDKINNRGEGDLWIEAVEFSEKEDESDAYIELRFEFTPDTSKKGLARTATIQSAVVRIAPWIMASDLDPTHQVWLRGTAKKRRVKARVNDPANDVSLEEAQKINPGIKIDQYLEEPITSCTLHSLPSIYDQPPPQGRSTCRV